MGGVVGRSLDGLGEALGDRPIKDRKSMGVECPTVVHHDEGGDGAGIEPRQPLRQSRPLAALAQGEDAEDGEHDHHGVGVAVTGTQQRTGDGQIRAPNPHRRRGEGCQLGPGPVIQDHRKCHGHTDPRDRRQQRMAWDQKMLVMASDVFELAEKAQGVSGPPLRRSVCCTRHAVSSAPPQP